MTTYGIGHNNVWAQRYDGNYVPAQESDVREGTQYGANGTEFTGTLTDVGNVTVPVVTDVRRDIVYGLNDALTGVIDLPAPEVVLLGVGYGANSSELFGTLQPGTSGESPQLACMVIGDDYKKDNGRELTYSVALTEAPVKSTLSYWNCLKDARLDSESTDITDTGGGIYTIIHEIDGDDSAASLVPGNYEWALTIETAAGDNTTTNTSGCGGETVQWISSSGDGCC